MEYELDTDILMKYSGNGLRSKLHQSSLLCTPALVASINTFLFASEQQKKEGSSSIILNSGRSTACIGVYVRERPWINLTWRKSSKGNEHTLKKQRP